MLQMVQTACPRCKKMVYFLKFWRKVKDKYFHLCEECCVIPPSEDDLLLIGFHFGYEKSREDVKNFLIGEKP